LSKLIMDTATKLRLGYAFGFSELRTDASQQTGFRVGQIIGWRFAEDDQGVINDVKMSIGTNSGKLRRPVPSRINPKGFVIVPKKARFCHK